MIVSQSMSTTSTQTPTTEDVGRDRAVRLFTYLKELTELRSEVKRSCDEYDQVVWWTEIPKENECYCAAWDIGREPAYQDWLRVERPRRKTAAVTSCKPGPMAERQ